jgi:CheY-like chemotaxis protein
MDVAEASEAVLRELPRVVLLDIALPGPDGWTFLMQLRAKPNTRDIPVVAVTALDAPPAAYRKHLAGFFTKPVSRDALVQRLAEVTGAARERVAVG